MEYHANADESQPLSRRERRLLESQEETEQVALPDLSEEAEAYVLEVGMSTLDDLLKQVVADGASDLHISCKVPPRYRIDGDLIVIPGESDITERWMEAQIQGITTDKQWAAFKEDNEADFSYELEGYGRFRVNVFLQRGMISSVMRLIPTEIKTLAQLQLPASIGDLINKKTGLILVTGPTGSGKSTTLTAMVDAINATRSEHIITIEDPIEFVHEDKKSMVSQREVNSDTKSFNEALRRVLRQDPDVILIGELRDAETISIALTAAETGHLVFGTLHTQSAEKTIDRIIDTFPSEQQDQVRSQLADTLQSVISQFLVKKVDGGRIAATEILVRNNAIRNNIKEGNNSMIYSAMQTGRKDGMHTLDQDLKRLASEGVIDKGSVKNLLKDPTALDNVIVPQNNMSKGYSL